MRIRIQLFTFMRNRIQLLLKVMGICVHYSVHPPGLYLIVQGPVQFYFDPLNLSNFYFIADPEPASKHNADPCGLRIRTRNPD